MGIINLTKINFYEKIKFRLKRGTTEIFITAGIWISTAANSFLVPINYMDPTPSGDGSTSITYSIYGFMSNSTGSYYANYDDSSTEVVSSMTLMEIVG